MAIRLVSVPSLIIQGLQDVYKEKLPSPTFLRSFFRPKTTAATVVSVETTRKSAIISKDRKRGSSPQKNRADKSTLKQFDTPFYNESFNVTQLDAYTRLAGQGDFVSESELEQLLDESAEKVIELQQKIERTYELKCSEVLFNGTLTFEELDDIDFMVKPESRIAASTNGGVFSSDTSDIIKAIAKGCQFCSVVGNAQKGQYVLLANGDIIDQIISNQKIQKLADLKDYDLEKIVMPEYVETSGASYHGTITAKAYKVHLWSTDQHYVDAAGDQVSYLPDEKAAIFPMKADFHFRYAGVANIDTSTGMFLPKKGEWHVRVVNDEKGRSTEIEVASSGIPIIYAVDQIAVINTEL